MINSLNYIKIDKNRLLFIVILMRIQPNSYTGYERLQRPQALNMDKIPVANTIDKRPRTQVSLETYRTQRSAGDVVLEMYRSQLSHSIDIYA